MAKTSADKAIRAHVEAFVAELSVLVHQAALETVQDALAGAAPPRQAAASKKPGRPRKTAKPAARKKGKGGRRVRRSSGDLQQMSDSLLAHVRRNPGQGIEQISREIGIASADLKHPVTLLLEAKSLRKEGQRRGTKYFPAGRGKATAAAKKPATKKKPTRKKAAKRKATKKKAAKKKAARKTSKK